jgi:hypothetical protein
MDNPQGPQEAPNPARNRLTSLAIFHFPFFIFLFAVLVWGCAAPAEPIERKAPVPRAVTDLNAVQSGNGVVLRFTLPKETVDRRPLKQPPAIEVYRIIRASGPAASASAAASQTPRLILTIPAAMVDQYIEYGRIRVVDSLKAEDFRPDGQAIAEYTVRTRASTKKQSPDSNSAQLNIYPAADSIADLKAEIVRSGVVLTWTAPQRTLIGSSPTIAKYHLYRAELEVAAALTATEAENSKSKTPFLKIGESETQSYRDSLVEHGKSYIYSVRSVAQYPNALIESNDSNFGKVIVKGTFPPAAPQGLVVVFVPVINEAPEHIELSWAINPETDIAGYNVYRSEQEGAIGTRLNPELLLTPAFRDMNALPGRRYFYTVAAVDRSGNESPISAAVPGSFPAESQQVP